MEEKEKQLTLSIESNRSFSPSPSGSGSLHMSKKNKSKKKSISVSGNLHKKTLRSNLKIETSTDKYKQTITNIKELLKNWGKTNKKLLVHFNKNHDLYKMYKCALLSYFIYTNFSLMSWVGTPSIKKLIHDNPEITLGVCNLTEDIGELYSRLGQTIVYSLPYLQHVNNFSTNSSARACVISYDENNIYVTFRGTADLKETVKDGTCISTTNLDTTTNFCSDKNKKTCAKFKNYLNKQCEWKGEICTDNNPPKLAVGMGFVHHYDTIKKDTSGTDDSAITSIIQDGLHLGTKDPIRLLYDLANIKQHKSKPILISGHSLGASTALIFAGYVALKAINNTHAKELHSRISHIYLYGCPATGNMEFKNFMESNYSDKIYNCIYESDWVPSITCAKYIAIGKYHILGSNKIEAENWKSVHKTNGFQYIKQICYMGIKNCLGVKSLLDHIPLNYINAIYFNYIDIIE